MPAPHPARLSADRMTHMLNDAALVMMVGLGHELGLFDALDDLGASSSRELATALSLHERFVREWLAAMVNGGLIHQHEAEQHYRLPSEHAALLCRRAGAGNWAAPASALLTLAGQRETLLAHFRQTRVASGDAMRAFARHVAQNTALAHEQCLIEHILPLAPGLPDRLAQGLDVAELGCGYGASLLLLAHAFPLSRFTGYDLDAEAIAQARLEAQLRGLSNLRFEQHDVSSLPCSNAYDLVLAFDVVHELPAPLQALRAVASALRPGGVFLMAECRASGNPQQDRQQPLGAFFYTVSCMHCLPVALAQGGEALGAMWGEEAACHSLRQAGLGEARVAQVPGDEINNYFICQRA